MCGAVHCSDIGLVGIHRKPPMVDHEWADQLCEIPLAVSACPTAAVRPTKVEHNGNKVNSIAIKEDRCMPLCSVEDIAAWRLAMGDLHLAASA